MIHNQPITVLETCVTQSHTLKYKHTHTHTQTKNEYYTAIIVRNQFCSSSSIDRSHGVMPAKLQRCKHRPEIEAQKQCRD